ncbi:hypothetical protein BOX15_Mlig030344g1 [Macrostomum lignano]|uniref:Uncharacterized protein n=1 Tax=Macrostomum lignano TaxID=282301 RepID=A0A267DKL5_9PLAT|nr:hypothetical protein BOX15_Mlig030344g1 [Macrostomum lignano]
MLHHTQLLHTTQLQSLQLCTVKRRRILYTLSSFQAQKAKHRMPAKQNQQQGAGKQQAADANKDAKQQKQQQQQQQAGGAAAKAGQKK